MALFAHAAETTGYKSSVSNRSSDRSTVADSENEKFGTAIISFRWFSAVNLSLVGILNKANVAVGNGMGTMEAEQHQSSAEISIFVVGKYFSY